MHTVHAPKRDDNIIRVGPVAQRGRFAPAVQRHKDKRRKAKVKERAELRRGDY